MKKISKDKLRGEWAGGTQKRRVLKKSFKGEILGRKTGASHMAVKIGERTQTRAMHFSGNKKGRIPRKRREAHGEGQPLREMKRMRAPEAN